MRSILLFLLFVMAGPVAAGPGEDDARFSINGFGSLGLTRSSSGDAAFVRELTQPKGSRGDWSGNVDTLFGVQANWQLNDRFALTAQAISRYHRHGTYAPELAWAFARFDPTPFTSLRLGRLGTDFYLYADSRMVGYTYLTVRPSADFFGVLPFTHLDGGDLQVSVPLGDSVLTGRLHGGRLNEKFPLADRIWDIGGSRMFGGSLSLQRGPWTVRLSTSEIRFKGDLPIGELSDGLNQAAAGGFPQAAAAARAIALDGTRSRFNSLGVVYESGPWQGQLMLSRVRHTTRAFQNWHSGYLLGGYRIGSVTPFAGYSWIRSSSRQLASGIPDGVSPALDELNAGLATVLRDGHADQGTLSLGARWDFAENMDLKVQLDLIRGRSSSVFPYRDEKADWNGRTGVVSVVLDFVF